MKPTTRLPRICAAIQLGVCLLAFGLLAWRASLPNNQHRDTDQIGIPFPDEKWTQVTDGYDDVVTVVTARNFARDGFLRTHLLPDRHGAPLASFFDFEQSQCRAIGPRPPAPRYLSVIGQWIDMVALNGQCIYTHYPPLADWIFGAMASMGFDRILHYRLLALAVSCATLLLLFLWLRREVHPVAALLATALVAVSPAFFEWAATLFHVSFQYGFLVAGLLCWSLFLERRQRRWFVLTFALFFCEALVSYELIAFFALAVVGLAFLDGRGASWGRRLGWVALQAAAPVAAVLLHLGLRVSLFGVGETWRNLMETFGARVGVGWTPWRVQVWLNCLQLRLLRFDLAILAAGVVIVVRLASRERRRPWRPVALSGLLLGGGLSFLALFPGTTWVHGWMMYRHLLPLTALLFAYVFDTALRFPRLWRGEEGAPASLNVRALSLLAVATALLVGGWSLRQSARAIERDVRWVREANLHRDPGNLAVRFLDVLYWTSATTGWYEFRSLLAVDGRRVNLPANPYTTFLLLPDVEQHYEIWWLDEQAVTSLGFLTEGPVPELLRAHCALSAFDGLDFRPMSEPGAGAFEPFRPDPAEPTPLDYRWWRVPLMARTRAVRLTCNQLPQVVPLHEVEVH